MNPRPGIGRAGLLPIVVGLLASTATIGVDEADARQACDRVADRERDLRTFVRSLSPGTTACFLPGTHRSWVREIKVTAPRVTLMSKPGARRARIVGRLRIARGANRVRVRRLRLDGRNQGGKASPVVNANHAVFKRNNVTNRHSGICFLLGNSSHGHAHRTIIRRNRIHRCGVLPATNHHHGIYVAYATGTVIRSNWIFDNADRGIQLYPNASGSLIRGNVIDGNGQGLNFSCDRRTCSRSNLVEGNVISHSTLRWNVYANSQGASPDGSNVLRRNCLWATRSGYTDNGGVALDPDFFGATRNRVARPRYVDRSGKDFRLRPRSRCRSVLG